MSLATWLVIDASFQYQPDIFAKTCGLWFCVQTYNVTVLSNIQSQKIISNFSSSDFSKAKLDLGGSAGDIFNNLPEQVTTANGSGFGVELAAWVAIGESVQNLLNATVTYGRDLTYQYLTATSVALFNVSSWDFFVHQMALSLTNNLGSLGETLHSPTFDSLVFSTVPVIIIRWPWFAYLIALVSLSVIFLLLSIWQASRQRVPPWKSNSLPVL